MERQSDSLTVDDFDKLVEQYDLDDFAAAIRDGGNAESILGAYSAHGRVNDIGYAWTEIDALAVYGGRRYHATYIVDGEPALLCSLMAVDDPRYAEWFPVRFEKNRADIVTGEQSGDDWDGDFYSEADRAWLAAYRARLVEVDE